MADAPCQRPVGRVADRPAKPRSADRRLLLLLGRRRWLRLVLRRRRRMMGRRRTIGRTSRVVRRGPRRAGRVVGAGAAAGRARALAGTGTRAGALVALAVREALGRRL